jgi:hypothetical protein
LRAAGAPPEAVARADAAAERTATDIEVLACNWQTVEVYQRCQMTLVGGAHGARCMGIAAREVHTAVTLMRVARPAWPDVLDGVQLMGREAAGRLNGAATDAAPSRR